MDRAKIEDTFDEWEIYPSVFSGYSRDDKPLGQGSFGVVFAARHTQKPDQQVAVKFLHRDLAENLSNRNRFKSECQCLSKLRHPNCVRVHGSNESGKIPYLIMEFVKGPELSQLIAKGPLGFGDAARIAKEIALALQHAHDQTPAIIHRDVKPRNVRIERATLRTVLMDFGLAKALPSRVSRQSSGLPASRVPPQPGTPEYMSPEQADPRLGKITVCSDVYALGATLYEMLTGVPPYPLNPGAGDFDIEYEIRWRSYRPIRDHRPDTPRALVDITKKCLQKNPLRRYQSAGEVASDLERYAAGLPVSVRLPGLFERLYDFAIGRSVTLLIATTLGVSLLSLALLIGFIWRFQGIDSNPNNTPTTQRGSIEPLRPPPPLTESEALIRAASVEMELENAEQLTVVEAKAQECLNLIDHHPVDRNFAKKGEWLALKCKAINTLGIAYLDRNLLDQAEKQFRRLLEVSLENTPDRGKAFAGLATIATERLIEAKNSDREKWRKISLDYWGNARKVFSHPDVDDKEMVHQVDGKIKALKEDEGK